MIRIALDGWSRRVHYEHYRAYANPWFTVSSRVPCAAVVQRARAHGRSVFAEMLWGAVDAANQVPALRQRLREDGVVQHDSLDPSFTVDDGKGGFFFHIPAFDPDPTVFAGRVGNRPVDGPLNAPMDGLQRDDLLFVSCLRWIDTSHIEPAIRGNPLDSVPMLHWGKVVDGAVGVSLTTNHMLVDGQHVAAFYEALQCRWGLAG